MQKIVPPHAVLIPDDAEKVFSGEVFDVYHWPQERFDGSIATFEMLKRPDTVEFIAIRDDKLLLVEEEQPNKPLRLRFPGGRVDSGEDWSAAVQRECLEELGLRFHTWKLVLVDQPASKIEWFCATFIATDFQEETASNQDAGERIFIKPYSFEEAKAKIMSSYDNELSYIRPLFDSVGSLDELLAVVPYQGKIIERN